MINKNYIKYYVKAAIFLFGFAGIICILFVTSQGVGLSPDTAEYIGAARTLLAGKGLSVFRGGELVPLTHYPPLFPLLITIPGAVGIDPMIGARWVNALFFGANIILVGYLVREMAPNSMFAPVLASFLLLTSTTMFNIHTMAWSEPTFIFFSLFGFAALARFIDCHKRAFLVIAATSTGLAFLARYPGVVLVFVGVVSLLFLSRRESRDRFADILLFGAIAGGPIVIWFMRNLMLGTDMTNREVGVYIISLDKLEHALTSLSVWFLPWRFAGPVSGGLLLCAISAIVISALHFSRRNRKQNECLNKSFYLTHLFSISAIFVVSYLVFLVFSISFVDPGTPLDDRILSPVYVMVLVMLVSLTAVIPQVSRIRTVAKLFTFSFFTMILAMHLSRAPEWIVRHNGNGRGYASTEWRTSKIIEFVGKLSTEAVIFSNGPDAIYLLTNLRSRMFPRRANYAGKKPNRQDGFELAEMGETIRKYDGYLVYFSTMTSREYLPNLEDLRDELPLQVVFEADDGSVFTIAE